MLHRKHPLLSVVGDNFHPPPWRLRLSQLLSFAKIALIVAVVGNVDPFPFLGIDQTPNWFLWLASNKLYGCLMVFFICKYYTILYGTYVLIP